jgi:hypothetical protein
MTSEAPLLSTSAPKMSEAFLDPSPFIVICRSGMTAAGIDAGGQRKGFHAVALRDALFIATQKSTGPSTPVDHTTDGAGRISSGLSVHKEPLHVVPRVRRGVIDLAAVDELQRAGRALVHTDAAAYAHGCVRNCGFSFLVRSLR